MDPQTIHGRYGAAKACELCGELYWPALRKQHTQRSRRHKWAMKRTELTKKGYVRAPGHAVHTLRRLSLYVPRSTGAPPKGPASKTRRRQSRSKKPPGGVLVAREVWVPREVVRVFKYLRAERQRAHVEAMKKLDRDLDRLTKRLVLAASGKEKWTKPLQKRWKTIQAFVTETTMVTGEGSGIA